MSEKHEPCQSMGCGCLSEEGQAPGSVEPRRRILRLVVGLAAGMTSRVGFTDNSQIKVGDRLVLHTAEGEPVALRLADVEPGKVVTAYPFDPATKKIRNESRLNKVLLVRIDKSKLDEQTKQRAAGDVLAFSGVCTHAGCDVNAWMKQTSKLLCYCHGSQFDPYKSGKVAAGPAPRKLPWLPVKLEGEEFVVAGPFSAPAGAPA